MKCHHSIDDSHASQTQRLINPSLSLGHVPPKLLLLLHLRRVIVLLLPQRRRLTHALGAVLRRVRPHRLTRVGRHDIIHRVRYRFGVPTFAYNVSGEYAMLRFAADNGALDYERVMMEVLTAFKRAGCNGVLTYFAIDAARILNDG